MPRTAVFRAHAAAAAKIEQRDAEREAPEMTWDEWRARIAATYIGVEDEPAPPRRTKIIDCATCGGSGQQALGHPNDPSPREIICPDCDGTGEDEVELEDIDEEDLF